MYETVDAVFRNLHYDKGALEGNLCIFFEIQGADSHLIQIEDGRLLVHRLPKHIPSDSLLIKINSEDFLNCVNEETDLQMLLLQGRLKIDGDLIQVLRLPIIFPRGEG